MSFLRAVLWSADHETGNMSQWYQGDGGGEFNSGSAVSSASRDQAHSGAYSAKLTISAPPVSGARLFRWKESQAYPALYYSAWYFFPQSYTISQYWNVFQWKSKTPQGNIDPFIVLNVGNRSNGAMYLYAYDWQRRITYGQSTKDIPIGQWFKVEAFYKCAADGSGQATFWQDGMQIINIPNVQTRYSNGDCQWSVDNYSNGVNPTPATIYIDDAVVSTTRGEGPAYSAPPPPVSTQSEPEVSAPAEGIASVPTPLLIGFAAVALLLATSR